MSKVYSSKSNASKAAKKVPGATVAQNDAGQWAVVLPGVAVDPDALGTPVYDGLIADAAAAEGVDEQHVDDVPTVQVEAPAVDADQAAYDAKRAAGLKAPAARSSKSRLSAALAAAELDRAAAQAAADADQEAVTKQQAYEAAQAAQPEPVAAADAGSFAEAPAPMMQLSLEVAADLAARDAQALANRTGHIVTITSLRTGNVVQVVRPAVNGAKPARAPAAPKAPKAARAPAAPRSTGPSPMLAAVIELCKRPAGATVAQLYNGTPTTSVKGVVWTDYLKAAEKLGYTMRKESVDGALHYFLA